MSALLLCVAAQAQTYWLDWSYAASGGDQGTAGGYNVSSGTPEGNGRMGSLLLDDYLFIPDRRDLVVARAPDRRGAGFPTCRFADFQVGRALNLVFCTPISADKRRLAVKDSL